MKKLNLLLLAGAVAMIAACGPSAKELAEKAKQDSIRIADSLAKVKAYEDSVAAAQAAQAAEQARLDSIAKAEEAAKAKGGKKK
ncbi:MAG: hypothetical protein HPY80_07455 [Bacteroidales bacterium]|jgi:hypothetical protein|nr:hypothetical protein [Bacteroidales bacterium]NPV36490.1 hypothetical protein [Bacteroidales bacterium]